MGIYLEEPGRILRPQVNNTEKLDGNLLVYGDVLQPLALCEEEGGNRSSVPLIFFISAQVPCVQSGPRGQGRPLQVDMVVEGDATGEHRVYAAANNDCSSAIRSEAFTISCKFCAFVVCTVHEVHAFSLIIL